MPLQGGFGTVEIGLLVVSAIASLWFLFLVRQPSSLKRASVKTLSIVALCLLALISNAPAALLVALMLAAFGDFFLAFDGERIFKIGLAGFLLAQLAYVVAFAQTFEGDWGLIQSEPWRYLVAALVVANSLVLGGKLLRILPRAMAAPIAVYAVVITTMGLASLLYAPMLVVAGAVMFILSDSLIAYERFLLDTPVNHHPWISPAVWITYYLAQVMITLGMLIAISG
ncbi:MAG: lysoplasmalogenase family protein [Rhizobiaceae bacterium]